MRLRRSVLILAALGVLCFGRSAFCLPNQDVYVGTGSAGPYSLSYKNIVPNSETVCVDSLDEVRGIDYTIDPVAGTVTFTKPLPVQSAAIVTYQYDPATSSRNGSGLSLPMSFDLARNGSAALDLTALYHQGAAAAPGNLTMGLGGTWNTGPQTRLSTRVLFAPFAANASSSASQSSPDGIGLDFGATQSVNQYAQLSFGFVRLGNGFGGDAVAGVSADQQVWTVGGRFTPAKQLSATVNYANQQSLTGPAADQDKLATTLTYAPVSQVAIATAINQTDQGASSVNQEKVDLTVAAQPSLKFDTAVAVQEGDGTGQTTTSLGGTLTAIPDVELSGGYDWLHPYSAPCVGTTMHIDLKLKLSHQTVFTGGYKQTTTAAGAVPTGTDFYTFGLTHSLGDSLSVSLRGSLLDADSVAPVYTATANVGLKF